MVDILLPFWVGFGLFLGIVSGLTPGLHINNFAAMLLAISPAAMAHGLSPYHMAVIVLAASISQTFFDCIPAVFLGAPDSDTALTVLPGHSLMLDGRGIEAVRLSALGSAGSVAVALLLVGPLSLVFSSYYDSIMKYVGLLLLAIALLMIKTEEGPRIEGRGSLVHWKYKTLAAALFLTSGLLGMFAFSREGLLDSPMGLEPQVLLPLLSGIFGASSLLISLTSQAELPEQEETEIRLPSRSLAMSAFFGGLGGSVVAWIPGVSPSVAALCTRLGSPASAEEFLVSIAGVNTANALFSLVALYAIGRARSGAAAAISDLIDMNLSIMVQMMAVVVAVAAISYLCVIGTAKAAAKAISRINYQWLCYVVLASLAAMSLLLTGWFGLFIFFLSTLIGLIAPLVGIQRIHAMGVLMLPLIVYYV